MPTMQVRPVVCPLCGMPPRVDDPGDGDSFYYVVCVNNEAGCPMGPSWAFSVDAAIRNWNRDVMAVIRESKY